MAPMKLEEQLEEQPKEEKSINGNGQEPSENVDTNTANLAKSTEGMDKESNNLPTSRRHRKLPTELNHEIFYCLHLKTRRKFICGLGWDFYAMFRQILLKKSKRLRNPQGNAWRRSNAKINISNGGLNCSMNTNGWKTVNAEKGFPISSADCRMDNFPGTILYYYEVKILLIIPTTIWCEVGFTDGEISRSRNSYAIANLIPNGRYIYYFHLAGQHHRFQFPPEGIIRPEEKGTGNVVGCGLLMDPDEKLTIFFTLNGILIDRQFPIAPTADRLFPTVLLRDHISLEANFGDNPAKPFEYDIKKCPGMALEWI